MERWRAKECVRAGGDGGGVSEREEGNRESAFKRTLYVQPASPQKHVPKIGSHSALSAGVHTKPKVGEVEGIRVGAFDGVDVGTSVSGAVGTYEAIVK